MLREPVARDYSSYQHGVREELYLGKVGDNTLIHPLNLPLTSTFSMQVFEKIHTMLEVRTVEGLNLYGSQYASQLGYMLASFRRDQILVLSSTGTVNEHPHLLNSILHTACHS